MARRWPAPGIVALAAATMLAASPSSPAPTCEALPRADAAALTAALHRTGRATLVHVWASWCRPCVAEWPALAELLRDVQGRGVQTVILSLDHEDRAAAAARVLHRARVPGCGLRADLDAATPALRGLDGEWDGALPSTFVLDASGRLSLAQRGATDLPELRRALDRLVSSGRVEP